MAFGMSGRIRMSKMALREAVGGYLFIMPWLLGFLFFVAGPMIASFTMTFVKWGIVDKPQWVGFKNFRTMFTDDPLFWKSLYNTVYYTVFAVPLGIVASLSIALLLNQGVRGLSFYRLLYYVPAVTSGVATAILWIWLFNPNIGLLNYVLGKVGIHGIRWIADPAWSKPALIIMSLWGSGGGMVIFLAGLKGIPAQLYEAARVDGANAWQSFWWITIPQLTPVIFFNLVMGIIASFQVFTAAYVMTQGGPMHSTLFYVLYLFQNAFTYFHMGYASALAWILFIIVLIFTLIQFKLSSYWVYYEAEQR
ncbi:MAG: carbohydrate ABC transporter permease [bacterium]